MPSPEVLEHLQAKHTADPRGARVRIAEIKRARRKVARELASFTAHEDGRKRAIDAWLIDRTKMFL